VFPPFTKARNGPRFPNDKWILIKRVPEGIARALRLRARRALTMNLIRSSPFVRERPSRFHRRDLSFGNIDLSGNLSGWWTESLSSTKEETESCKRCDFPIKRTSDWTFPLIEHDENDTLSSRYRRGKMLWDSLVSAKPTHAFRSDELSVKPRLMRFVTGECESSPRRKSLFSPHKYIANYCELFMRRTRARTASYFSRYLLRFSKK